VLLDNLSCVITLYAIFVSFVFCFFVLSHWLLFYGMFCTVNSCFFFFVFILLLHACFSSLFSLCMSPLWLAACHYYYYHYYQHYCSNTTTTISMPLIIIFIASVGTCSGDFVLCYSQVPSGSDAVLPEGEYHLWSGMGTPEGVLVRSSSQPTLAAACWHTVPPPAALLPRQKLQTPRPRYVLELVLYSGRNGEEVNVEYRYPPDLRRNKLLK